MGHRVEVALNKDVCGAINANISKRILDDLGANVSCRIIDVYSIKEDLTEEELTTISSDILTDFNHLSSYDGFLTDFWRIEVGLLPDITDTIGKTTAEAIFDRIGKHVIVSHSKLYVFVGDELNEALCNRISLLVHDPLIENCLLHKPGSIAIPYLPEIQVQHTPNILRISLHMSKKRFETLMAERMLSLSVDEFMTIKRYFKQDNIIEKRRKVGLDTRITDVELELLAKIWSEQYRYKIFNALITYDKEGELHAINSLFNTFIRGATEQAKKPYVISAFDDTSGIIKFTPDYDLAIKVNACTDLSMSDPYNSVLAGVLGVQRDIVGSGLGAKPIADLNILCLGNLKGHNSNVPKTMLQPNSIFDSAVKGIEHGGNKMGIPTVNGSIVFEDGYSCHPIVYCGTVGIMPSHIQNQRTSDKRVNIGSLAVMVGGKIGKDGVHDSTYTGSYLDKIRPNNSVQVGDPSMQKRLFDFVLDARDKLFYSAITGISIGGLASSVSELAQISGGCEIYLDKCPLKYPGLDPWEILLSESHERMVLVVPTEKLDELLMLAKFYGVEATMIGKFTDSKKFHVLYGDKTVAYLGLEFLHNGAPQLKLKATWKKFLFTEPSIAEANYGELLLRLLSSSNITSRECVIRRYDHEVQGASVIKPIMFGPTDGAVLRPLYHSDEGVVIAHGLCPRYVQDGYAMAASAFDEAVRNAIATGARFGYLSCLDNFCWPDQFNSAKTSDSKYKLGNLVRACISLYDCATGYGIPIISSKNNMENDYCIGETKFSIHPTLLITMIGKIDDVKKARSSEFRAPGDVIYVLGTTKDELGGSELYKLFNGIGNDPPQVNIEQNLSIYKALSAAIEDGLVCSAHDMSDGGLAVAFAECVVGLGLAADLDLSQIHAETNNDLALLFSESTGRFIVSVKPENVEKFEYVMHGTNFRKVGRVRGDSRFIIRKGDTLLVNLPVESLQEAYGKGLKC